MPRRSKIDPMIDWSSEPDLVRLHRAHQLLRTDPETAIADLGSLADRGSLMSMIYLGNVYKIGTAVPVDLAESERWYRQAADAGSVTAYYELGRLYLRNKRYEEAKIAFEIAAKKNYIPAVHFLGRMYFYGQGVTRNVQAACKLLEQASAGGSIYARRLLGQALMQQPAGLSGKLRGIWLLASGAVMLTLILITREFASDQLR